MEKIKSIFKKKEEKQPFIKPAGYKSICHSGYQKILDK